LEALEALIEGAADGLVLLSTQGEVLRVNEAATELLGVPRDDLVGRFVADDPLALNIDEAWALDAISGRNAVSRTIDLPGGRKALVTLRAWRDVADQPRYLLLVMRDVTGIGQLVSNAHAGAPGDAARWWQMRRSDVGVDRIVMESSAMRAVAEKALQFAQV